MDGMMMLTANWGKQAFEVPESAVTGFTVKRSGLRELTTNDLEDIGVSIQVTEALDRAYRHDMASDEELAAPLGWVVNHTSTQILRFNGIGRKCLKKLQEALAEYGLKLLDS